MYSFHTSKDMTEQTPHRTTKDFDIRTKTAAAVTIMNILLTGIKFFLYALSGSMAILAEAWHSFSDIATSLLIFVAIRHSVKNSRKSTDPDGGEASGREEQTGSMEIFVSLGIGLLLTIIAVMLLRKAVYTEAMPISRPLISGFVFLAFSVGSYFIYRFETRVGRQEGSIGLVSDGMHARADMIASLLTGFSLVIYAMGLDLDRWVAGLIALFILSFALETLFNVGLVFFRHEKEYLFRYRSYEIVGLLFNRDAGQQAAAAIDDFCEERFGRAMLFRSSYKIVITIVIILIGCAYASTSFFTLGIQEKAVVERFGRPVRAAEPVGPGIHVKLPWPVDRVRRLQARSIEKLPIGNIGDAQQMALLWTRRHGTEEPFLSGDNNFFYPYIVVHYRIKNIFHYLYEHTEPKRLLNEAGHRIATALFAGERFYAIATTHRGTLEQEMFTRLQNSLDRLKSGIEIVSINFKDIHPPMSVADSFERVIAGYQQKQEIINQAAGYRNKALPETRARAAVLLEQARGYINDREKRAEGKAGRFSVSLPDTQAEKRLTMSRRHLQMIQDVMKNTTKVFVDPAVGDPEIWMGFENMTPLGIKGGNKQ